MMEHLNFTGRASQEELGRALAKMHLAEPTVSPASLCKTLESPVSAASALLPHCDQSPQGPDCPLCRPAALPPISEVLSNNYVHAPCVTRRQTGSDIADGSRCCFTG